MKNRLITVMLLIVLVVTLAGNAQAMPSSTPDSVSLVYVDLTHPDDLTRFAATHLPMYVHLDEGLLTGANRAEQQNLLDSGLTIQVLDLDLRSATYYLVESLPGRTAPDYAAYGQVLLEIDDAVLLRMDPSQADALAQAGAELRQLSLTPKPLPSAQAGQVFPTLVEPDPIVQGMIDQISETQVYTYDRQLAGELPVWVDGDWYTILTRNTYSGTPIQKTTHYVGQHMQDLGLDVDYYVWNNNTNPDVIGEIPGLTNPEDIFIIGAHIDDVNGTPGADDNASGSVATLLAADLFSQYQWGCTMRFAFWTGEEQGLLGSEAYAQNAYNAGENILGYLNLDMIAWNTIGSDPYINLSYTNSIPPSLALAQLFGDVIDAYDINLLTRYIAGMWGSDHNSFWDFGFNSILAIEDDDDFNPYYHGSGDTPAHTDPTYFTNFVKASIATYAHMSGCLIPPENGTLTGTVTLAGDGSPLASVIVTADDGQGNTYPATTGPDGNYNMLLPSATYTVTAALDGYIPQSKMAVIVADQETVVDFALEPVCIPVNGLDFSWLPVDPFNGDLVTFTAIASGTLPIDFQWDFGDTYTATGETVTHTYPAGSYPVDLQATNACGQDNASQDILVNQYILELYLPVLYK